MIALEKVATRIWRSRRNLVSARRGLPWMEGATAGSNRSRRLVGTNTDHPPGAIDDPLGRLKDAVGQTIVAQMQPQPLDRVELG